MNTSVAHRTTLLLFIAAFVAGCSSADCPSGGNAGSLFCHRVDAAPSDARDGSIDAGCHSDTDCPTGMRCDVSTHQCVMGCGPGTMCPTGQTCCNGTCADTQTSASNCGICGRACMGGDGVGGACIAGACHLACPSGHADCDGVASTGCEVDLGTDPTHCGMCSTTCTAPANAIATCMGGTCSFTCMPGFADCNHLASDGCEVNTNTDAANCGMCGHSCAPGICDGTGACRPCTPGMSCSSGPVCQHTGTISCTPTGPVCGNFVNDPPGTGCGADHVCDGAGMCIACMQNASCTPTGAPCDSGSTDCSTGSPVCTDTGHLPAGTSCGMDMVCDGAGHCNACAPGPCSIPGDLCHTATIDCSSGAPVCAVSGNVAAGTMCGAGHVCDGAGTCVACVDGMACNPSGDLCQTGMLSCSTGAPVCAPSGNAPAGTTCGMGMVCDGSDHCVPCAAGSACIPANVCDTGTIGCSTGAPVCGVTGHAPGGTPCGLGRVCDGMGMCIDCQMGQACSVPIHPCQTGALSCITGVPQCNATGNVAAGRSCGMNQVCDGLGNCVPCTTGMSCAPGGNTCETGSIACGTGAPVCNMTGNVAAGTSCGTQMVCNGSGMCVTCRAGMACTPGGNVCRTGSITCGTGAEVCTATGSVAAGTSCGTNQVCDGAGTCVMCTAGMACNPGGNVCRNGAIACSTGAPVCNPTTNVAAGTSCGTNHVCDGSGNCVMCTAGLACNPGGNLCVNGSTSCSSGAQVCNPTSNVAAGTSCGTNLVCDGSGHCNPCTTAAACHPSGNLCVNGTTSCTTGAPVCNTTTNVAAGTSCGTNQVCDGAGHCVACTMGMSCAPGGNACLTGAINCSTGGPVCRMTGYAAYLTSCGSGRYCDGSGTCCQAGWGSYGDTNLTWTAPGQQWQFEADWCSTSAAPGCYSGYNVNYFQRLSFMCTAPGSGGSCTDPDATYTVTCGANVQCQYDCSGSCNPTSC